MSHSGVEVAAEIIDIQRYTMIPYLTAPGVLIETCRRPDILDYERSERELKYSPSKDHSLLILGISRS